MPRRTPFRTIATLAALLVGVALAPSVASGATPILGLETQLTASDGSELRSIDIDGDTIVAGANLNDDNGFNAGAVFIFVRAADGTWSEQAKLYPTVPVSGGLFGNSVAIDGDVIVVGAPESGSPKTGRAYIFERSGTTWTEKLDFAPTNPGSSNAHIGNSVDIDGATAIVGSQSIYTKAHVLHDDGTGWAEQAVLEPTSDLSPTLVDVDGDRAAVAPIGDSFGGESGAGSITTYTRSGGTWTEEQEFGASDAVANQNLGAELELEGDRLVAGAPNNGSSNFGAVYTFALSGGTWSQESKVEIADLGPGDRFGRGLGLSGDRLVAGAPQSSVWGNQSGSATYLERSGSTWEPRASLDGAADVTTFIGEGGRLSVSGETAVSLVAGDVEVYDLTPPPPSLEFGFGAANASSLIGLAPGAPVQIGVSVQGATAEPINTYTGAFWDQEVDLTLPGAGVPFSFSRTYNSNDTTVGTMGPGWTHSLDASLDIDAGGDVTVRAGNGQQLSFRSRDDGTLVPTIGSRVDLETITGGYRLTYRDQSTMEFDSTGNLTAYEDRNGQGLSLSYAAGALDEVTDSAGRAIDVTTDGSGRITSLTLPDARSVSYAYDPSGRLETFTDLRGKTTTYAYDASDRLITETDHDNVVVLENTYDAGRVTQQEAPLGAVTTFAWDPATQTSTTTDPAGKDWVHVYDDGVLASETNPEGDTITYARDVNLGVTSVIDGRGNETRTTYDARGNMLSRTAPAPLSYLQEWTYDAQDNVLTETDGRGNTTTYGYDALGNLTSITQPDTETVTMVRDAATGLVTSRTDQRGKTTTFGYDADHNLISITSPLGHQTTMAYDASGRLVEVVDPRGNEAGATPADFATTYTYDDADNRLTETTPLAETTTWSYDDVGNLTQMVDAESNIWGYAYNDARELISETAPDFTVTTHTYDARGLRSSTATAEGNTTTFAYDDAGRLVNQVSPRGNVAGATPADFTTAFTYDNAGNLLTTTDPTGAVTTHAYDELNRRVSTTNARGHVRSVAYDEVGNQVGETDALGRSASWIYDAMNRPTSYTNFRGKTTSFAYDAAGNLVSETTPLGKITTYAYDDDGRRVSSVEPRGNVAGAIPDDYRTTFAFDAAGNLTTTTDPLGNATATAYDQNGRRASETDANTNATSFSYDALGRLISVQAPGGATTSYAYDPVGNLTTRSDALNRDTTFTYDDDRRMTSMTDPLARTTTFAYDANGNVSEKVKPSGTATPAPNDGTTLYFHDERDQLERINYLDSTPDVRFFYDGVGNRTRMVDGSGTTIYRYNKNDWLTRVIKGADEFAYTYDASGNVQTRTYPDDTIVDHDYRADELMVRTIVGADTTSYFYDHAGNLTRTERPAGNDTEERRFYDRAGRLTRIRNLDGTGALVSRAIMTLDPVGNPTRINRESGVVETFAYDARNRLTEFCEQASCTQPTDPFTRYTYNDVSSRLTEERPAGTTTYTYDAADQLIDAVGPSGTTTYGYDLDGHQTTAGTRTSVFGLDDRMVSTTDAGVTWSYAYDGDGRRVAATDGTDTINTLWDQNHALDQLAIERDGTGVQIRRYHHGLDLVSFTDPSGTYYPNYTNVGSVSELTDSTGALHWDYRYDPFGNVITETDISGSAPENPMRFSGEYLDPTGLYHLRARQYDPQIGAFLSLDPVTPEIGDPYVTQYHYANQQPTVFVDPSGEVAIGAERFGPDLRSPWDELLSSLSDRIRRESRVIVDDAIKGPCLESARSGEACKVRGVPAWELTPQGGIRAGAARVIRSAAGPARAGLGKVRSKLSQWVGRTNTPTAGRTVQLTDEQEIAVETALGQRNRLRHIFDQPKHNLDNITEAVGGREELLRRAISAVPRGTDGELFSTTSVIAGRAVTIEGRYINGVPRISNMFAQGAR